MRGVKTIGEILASMTDNDEKAARSYRIAAEGNDPEGQFEYGQCLRDGKGVKQNLPEAIEWFRKAADRGNAEAKQVLSQMSPVATQPVDTQPTQTKQDGGIGCFLTILKVFGICFLIGISIVMWPITLIVVVALVVIAKIVKKSK
jgi:hypothetical protein